MVGAWVVNMEEVLEVNTVEALGVTMEEALEVIMMMGLLVVSFEALLYFRNGLEHKTRFLITKLADIAAFFALCF